VIARFATSSSRQKGTSTAYKTRSFPGSANWIIHVADRRVVPVSRPGRTQERVSVSTTMGGLTPLLHVIDHQIFLFARSRARCSCNV
jgi:hypothetical protein